MNLLLALFLLAQTPLGQIYGGTGAGALTCTSGQPATSNGSAFICQSTPMSVAYGGTGGSATPTSGGVAYGTGSAYAFTAVGGGSSQCLTGTNPPTWGSCGAGGWTTILDLDLTTQPSQTLSPDGNYTIGGLTFKKENSTNDRVAMALTNGTGLVVQPVASSEYNVGTRTLPLLWMAISQLSIPNLDWSTAIRVWVYISADNCSANYDNAVVGIDSDNTNYSVGALRGINGNATAGLSYRRTFNSGTTSAYLNQALSASNRVIVLPQLALAGIPSGNMFYGSYSGWPATSALSWGTGIQDAVGAAVQPGIGGEAAGNAPGNLGIVLGGMRAGSTNNSLSITFARLRVDYRL